MLHLQQAESNVSPHLGCRVYQVALQVDAAFGKPIIFAPCNVVNLSYLLFAFWSLYCFCGKM